MRRRQRSALLFAVAPLIAACGSSSATSGLGTQTTPPVVVKHGEVQVGCGGTDGWSASVMEDGVPGVLTHGQVERAFSDLLANPKYRDELTASFLKDGPAATPWRILRVTGDTYTLGLGQWTATGPGKGAMVFEMRGHPGAWEWSGGGDCHLAPVLAAGNEWVQVTAPATGFDRRSTNPEVGIIEEGCTGGRDPLPHLHAPFVEETSTTVTVYWTATPPTGNQNCVGIDPVDVPLKLTSPLGKRRLLDGSTFPPTRVARH
jgi:hypothetical protein